MNQFIIKTTNKQVVESLAKHINPGLYSIKDVDEKFKPNGDHPSINLMRRIAVHHGQFFAKNLNPNKLYTEICATAVLKKSHQVSSPGADVEDIHKYGCECASHSKIKVGWMVDAIYDKDLEKIKCLLRDNNLEHLISIHLKFDKLEGTLFENEGSYTIKVNDDGIICKTKVGQHQLYTHPICRWASIDQDISGLKFEVLQNVGSYVVVKISLCGGGISYVDALSNERKYYLGCEDKIEVAIVNNNVDSSSSNLVVVSSNEKVVTLDSKLLDTLVKVATMRPVNMDTAVALTNKLRNTTCSTDLYTSYITAAIAKGSEITTKTGGNVLGNSNKEKVANTINSTKINHLGFYGQLLYFVNSLHKSLRESVILTFFISTCVSILLMFPVYVYKYIQMYKYNRQFFPRHAFIKSTTFSFSPLGSLFNHWTGYYGIFELPSMESVVYDFFKASFPLLFGDPFPLIEYYLQTTFIIHHHAYAGLDFLQYPFTKGTAMMCQYFDFHEYACEGYYFQPDFFNFLPLRCFIRMYVVLLLIIVTWNTTRSYQILVSTYIIKLLKNKLRVTKTIAHFDYVLQPLTYVDQAAILRNRENGIYYPDSPLLYYGVEYDISDEALAAIPVRDDFKLAYLKPNERNNKPILAHVGISIGIVPHVVNSSQKSELVSIKLKLAAPLPPCDEYKLNQMYEFFEQPHIMMKLLNIKENISLNPVTSNSWLKNYTQSRAKSLKNYVVCTDPNIGSMFAKVEQVPGKDLFSKANRLVAGGTDEHNQTMGPFMSAYTGFIRVVWNHKFWIYGTGGAESAEIEGQDHVSLLESDYKAMTGDFSTFDITMRRRARMSFNKQIKFLDAPLSVVKAHEKKICKKVFTKEGLKCEYDATMGSGEMTTKDEDNYVNVTHQIAAFCYATGITLQDYFDKMPEGHYSQMDIDRYFEYCCVDQSDYDNCSLDPVNFESVLTNNKLITYERMTTYANDFTPIAPELPVYFRICGDDNLIYTKTYDEQCSIKHGSFIKQLGMVNNVFIHDFPDICSSIFWPCLSPTGKVVTLLGPKPGRVLAKLCNITKPLSAGNDLRRALAEKVYGVYMDSSFVPLISDIVNKHLELLSDLDDIKPLFHKYKAHVDYKHHTCKETMIFFYRRYPTWNDDVYQAFLGLVAKIDKLPATIHFPPLLDIYSIDNEIDL